MLIDQCSLDIILEAKDATLLNKTNKQMTTLYSTSLQTSGKRADILQIGIKLIICATKLFFDNC